MENQIDVLQKCCLAVNYAYPHQFGSVTPIEAAETWMEQQGHDGMFHGIEYVSMGGKTLAYLNVGETYEPTVCSVDDGCCFIDTWGGWYEAATAAHEQKTKTIRCGYCSEFTPRTENTDWREIECAFCHHLVGG